MVLKYTTTKQLSDILGMTKSVPSWEVGKTPLKEDVGTGNNSKTDFYLNHRYILTTSYTLYYGLSQDSVTPLTEITHYTLDEDSGKITLTAAGVTLLAEECIFAEYSYCSAGMTSEFLTTTLTRAEKEVDDSCNTTFTDGTVSNPAFPFILREKHVSQLLFKPSYFSEERPLIDIESTLLSGITDSATSITLESGDGTKFPTTGKILIGTELISYTGITTDTLTGCTRGLLNSTATTHSAGDEVHTTFIEFSETYQGGLPVWQFLEWGTKFVAGKLGKIYIYRNELISNIDQDVADRVRISYYHGYDTIPVDITRLTLLYAKRQLIQDNIGKSMIAGRDEFNPEMFNADMSEINMIVSAYRQNGMGNT